MKRFFIKVDEIAIFILQAFELGNSGEIWIETRELLQNETGLNLDNIVKSMSEKFSPPEWAKEHNILRELF